MNFIEELEWRGMIHTTMPGTKELLEKEMVTAYLGSDPSADSLLRHVKARSPFTEMYALPLTADEARRDTAACNRIIAGGLKDCKELLGRVRIVME